jgi:hypothetical protein
MSALTDLVLSPFAALLRLACAHPWISIIVCTVAGIGAELLHQDIWMSAFICFAAYMLMWLNEVENPAPVAMGVANDIE